MSSSEQFGVELDAVIEEGFRAVRQGPFWQHVKKHGWSANLYRLSLVQLAHLTQHTPMNIGLGAFRVPVEQVDLVRYCFEHAAEELGHDRLAVEDLQTNNLLRSADMQSAPLPATQALIGYLYFASLQLGPVARMGYSYWGESFLKHMQEMVAQAQSDLSLSQERMKFFTTHESADIDHAADVRKMLLRFADSEQQRRNVIDVARTSLYLMRAILDSIVAEHQAEVSKAA